MYRSTMLKRLAVLAILVTLSPILCARGMERPNILWIITEDNSPTYVGAYGNPLARTPHIDSLAREGITFRNAHAAAPVCSVSRASIITGMYASSLGTQHHRSSHPLPAGVRYFPEYLREAGYFTTNNAKTDYNTPQHYDHVWNENGSTAHWRHRAPGQPFFAAFHIADSHESSVYDRQPLSTDPAKVRVPAYLPDTPNVRADIAQYHDAVARADEKVGEVLKQLAADGLKDSTIVFYFSDHGGGVAGSKRFLLDHGTRIPIAARFPDRYRHLAPRAVNGRVGELVSAVDLAPTLLSLAGLPVPANMQGRAFAGPARTAPPAHIFAMRDRLDERYELSRAVIDGRFRYLRHFRPDLPNGRRAWSHLSAAMLDWRALWEEGKLDAKQRAFFEAMSPEQLFDVQADPDNVHDLAGDAKYRDVLLTARKALRQHMLAVRDSGLMPESMMDRLAAGRSPTVVSRDVAAYPLDQLLDFIDAVQLGSDVGRTQLLAATRHPLPLFRYWSAIGSIGADDPPDLDALLRDPDATVRLAAAEAIVKNERGSAEQAWKEIIAALRPGNAHALHLVAANIVADRNDRPEAAVAALRKLLPATATPLIDGQEVYDLAGLLQTVENRSNPFMEEFLSFCAPHFCPKGAPRQSPNVIFDTDIWSNIDDMLALAMLHALHDRGELNLVAVTISTNNQWAVPYVDLINTFYGHAEIPIGINHDGIPTAAFQKKFHESQWPVTRYTQLIAELRRSDGAPLYPHRLTDAAQVPEAVSVLRKTLAAQPDGSVVIVQVGYFTNLAHLMDSEADAASALNGRDLIKKKVRLLSMMAGNFRETTLGGEALPKGAPETNVRVDVPSAQKVFSDWPTALVASGFEIGLQMRYPGQSIEHDYSYVEHHPIADTYRAYCAESNASGLMKTKCPHDHATFDLTSVLHAARPDRRYFSLSKPGRITVLADGGTRFDESAAGSQRYLILDKEQQARTLEAMVMLASQPPVDRNQH